MKTSSIIILITALFITSNVQGQGWNLSELASNVGKGAFISGFDISTKFRNQNIGSELNITGNHQRIYFILGKDYMNFHFGISGGFFKNMPFIGPYIMFYPTSFLTFQHWSSWSAGIPDHPEFDLNDFYSSNSVFINIKYLTLSFVTMEFLDEWIILPGLRLNFQLNKKYTVSTGVEYKTQVKKNEPLFSMGISYKP